MKFMHPTKLLLKIEFLATPTIGLRSALALALEAAIWTSDNDFFGCGIATWTTDTLLIHLSSST